LLGRASGGLTPLYASIFTISLGLGAYLFLLSLYVQRLGGTYLDLGVVGAVRSLAYVLLPLVAGLLADHLGALRLFTFSVLVSGAAAGGAPAGLIGHPCGADPAADGHRVCLPLAHHEALVISSSADRERLRALGRYNISWGSGFLLGPLLGGYLCAPGVRRIAQEPEHRREPPLPLQLPHGGVDAGGIALQRLEGLGGVLPEPRSSRFGRPVKPYEPHIGIRGHRLPCQHLGQFTFRQPSLHVHLPEPIITVEEPHREEGIRLTRGKDIGHQEAVEGDRDGGT